MSNTHYTGFGHNSREILETRTEKEKRKEDYLRGFTDRAIRDLAMITRERERQAFAYYAGMRNQRKLQHLTDNYGVSNPVDMPFIPIMRPRIKALVNKVLQNRLDYKVTACNTDGIMLKLEEKRRKVFREVVREMENGLKEVTEGKADEAVRGDLMERLQQKFNDEWQADFEINAQHLVTDLVHAHDMLHQFYRQAEHACIAGFTIRRDFIREHGKRPETWICDPREVFYDKNPDSQFMEDCDRIVYRRRMSATQILNELGHYMTEGEREDIARTITSYHDWRHRKDILFYEDQQRENVAMYNEPYHQFNRIDVYHVEWKATSEVDGDNGSLELGTADVPARYRIKKNKRFKQKLYETYRIDVGQQIYVLIGESDSAVYRHDRPDRVVGTYKGFVLEDHFHTPFSMVTETMDLQDTYDITWFKLTSLIESAMPGGTYTVLEHLPKDFGGTPEERLLKATGYQKILSQKLIQLSQEGLEGQFQFNNYGNYPSNMDGNLVQALIGYLAQLEQTANKICGLNDRMLGEMEERDGKGTTMMAVQAGELITKHLYHLVNVHIKRTFEHLLNLCRISYAEGHMGSVLLGGAQKIYTLEPETFSLTDFAVHLSSMMDEREKLEKLDGYMTGLVQNQMVELKAAYEALMSDSIAEKKKFADRAFTGGMQRFAEERKQLEQQLRQMQKEMERLQKENQKAQVDMQKLELEKQKMVLDQQNRKKELDLKEKEIDNDRQTEKEELQAEIAQLMDNNVRNDRINRNR